jgi:hypothetical protein
MGGVIDDGQALDAAPFCRPVKHGIHRPDWVGGGLTRQRMAFRDRDFLPLAPPRLQASPGIKPAYPLVIDDLPGLAQFR